MTRKGKDAQPSPTKTYTRAEFARIAIERGWTIDKKKGKGSHWTFRKEGLDSFPLSQRIGTGLQEQVKKWLGIK